MKHNFLQINAAKAAQKTGGGNSQCQTSRSEGARQMTMMLEGATIEQPFSNHSAPFGTTRIPRGWKYAACLLLAFVLGIGQMWGADQTFTVSSPAVSKRYVKDNIMIGGSIGSKKLANVGSQACFYMASGSYAPTYILSKAANIKSITIQGNRDTGSSDATVKAFNVFTSSDLSTFTTPTTGFSASRTNNGSTVDVTSLSDIPMVGNNNSYLTSVTITFTSPVMGIRLTYSNSTCIKSISVTYDNAITVASQLCEVHMTTTSAASLSGTGTWTASNLQSGNTFTDTESTPNNYYYNKSSGTYGKIDLGEGDSFQAGDEIWVDMNGNGLRAPNACGLVLNSADNSTNAVTINPNCTIPANMPMYIRYVTQAGDPWVGQRYLWLRRVDSNDRMYQVTIHRAGGGDDPGDDPGDTPANYDVTHALTNNVVATSGATGASAATEGVDYDAVFAPSKLGYSLPSTISVTIGGNAATSGTDYTWNSSTGAFQVPAAKVTGNIVVTIAGVAPVKTFKSDYSDFTQVGETNAYYTYLTQANYTSYAATGWMEYDVPKTGEQKLLIDPATDEATTPASKSTYGIVKQVDTRYMEFYLTGITSVKFYFHNSNSSNDRTIKYKLNGGEEVDLVTVNRSTSNSASIALNSSTENTIRIYAGDELYVCAMKVTLPDASCAAGVPGNISKGTASGGTGSITLTAAGSPVSGDTWYWQSAEDGTNTSDEYDAENGKSVNAADTYYLRSYNTAGDCWSTAKSVIVAAADLLTPITPSLSYDASVIVGNTLSPTLTGNTGSGSVSYALNNVTPSGSLTIDGATGVVTAVTAGGTATVTATIAANCNYAGNTATSGTITVLAPVTGTATVSFALSGSTATGTVAGVSSISSLSTALTANTLSISGTKSGYSGAISGCTSETELVANDYVDVQFTVASGYAFTPSGVTVQVNPFKATGAVKAVVAIQDASLDVLSNVLACAKETDNAASFASGAFTGKEFEGTVHMRIYFYGPASSKTFYIKSPLEISGTVAVATQKYNLTFAKGDEGASGTMATQKYVEEAEVTLPACTFTPPTGKEFDAWVVTKTVGGAAITVTDGKFTMPAEAVTATATWKDLPAYYTVEYYDGESKLGEEEVEVGSKPTASGITTTKEFYTFAAWQLSGVDKSLTDASWTSVAKDATVTLAARYTGNYAFGAYSFVNVAEVGTAPNKLTMTNGTTVNVPAGSRVDNFYFSAMAIKYESGASTALNDYKGWKINTKDATIKFLVENNCHVKVAFGSTDAIKVSYTQPNGTEQNDINQAKETETGYIVKGGTLFTIKMATANTTTLKRITISNVYNVTYTDGTGDASGSASNVTEVTLPTPTETNVTVESVAYTFTGWKADEAVTVDDEEVAAYTLIAAGKTAVLGANTTFTAQWAEVTDFDVKFYRGYGEPDVQIGETQSISTGNYAIAPATDPTRSGYRFLGWSYDGTAAHIVTVGEYAITAATNFTAMWIQQFSVTFDGAGEVVVDNGATVASPNSPVTSGKVFLGWYNGESKYNFSAAVTGNLALESKWADADANHYVYAYNDDFHFDGVVYKTPEGATTDPDASEATNNLTTPYTLFSGASGITSIVATKAVYDYKKGADTKHVTAYLKLKKSSDDANSKLIFTIASGYTAVLKVKMGGYSNNPTVTLKKGDDAITAESGTIGGTATGKNYNEITYNLTSGVYEMTTSDQTLYFSNIDLEATALPGYTVTYKAGDGTGDDVVAEGATEVADCPNTFTAPTGKVFNGWKDALDNDVTVGDIVGADMTLTAQWINQYAVTFNMNGHGASIAAQHIVAGGKVTKPSPDPSESGYEFGGWYKEAGCTNAWNFATDVVTANTELFAKWTVDPCPTPFSLSKVVLTAANDGTVTGYNANEYAGEKVIGGLSSTQAAEVDPSHEGTETGYKLNNGGSAIVFATLKKGTFQEGDKVVVTITKQQDAYKVEEIGQPILDIYYGTSKDDATFLTTIENVTAAGSYTYRLTAADVTAIGSKKGIGVFRPSSGRTQNPYVYSVEITGCREWAITHTVTFNKMGKGADIAPAVVVEGDKVTKPTVVEPEGWALAGWYKEEGLVNEWDFDVDVMGEENITLYAKWEDETGAIKLFDGEGNLNTTNFVSPAKTTIEIDEVEYPCLAEFSSNRTSLAGATPSDMVQYNATTDEAKIKMTFYNSNSGVKKAILYKYEEGAEEPVKIEIEVPGQTIFTTDYYTFNSSKNRSFYVCMNDRSNIRVLQLKVMDNGTAIQQAGQAGYSLNLNKGRMYVSTSAATSFEGATINVSSEYKVYNNGNMATNSYISFTTTVDKMILKVTRSGGNYYVSQDPENKGTSYNTNKEIELSPAGTWYLGSISSGSAASFTKIEFIAPKCEAPAFNALANSDICSGDAYVALDGTGTVSDGGSITYKWYAEDDAETVLATTATYTPIADGSYYVVALHHVDGYTDNEVTSDVVTVKTHAAAVITTAPLNKRGEVGDEVTLTVAATGKNVAYKWYTCDENGDNEVALDPEQTGTSINVTITDAMEQWYKVKVTSDCGGTEALAKVSEFVPATPADVTESILWDWTSSAWSGVGAVAFTNKDVEELMADADAVVPNNDAFRSDMLYGTGQYVHRNTSDHFFQGSQIRFNNTVAGLVRVHFRSTGNDKDVELSINGTVAGSGHAWQWSSEVEVAAGGVTIVGTGIGSNTGYTRIDKIEFYALDKVRSDSWIAPGELGTVCYPNGHIVVGADMYQMAGVDENHKFAFDQVTVTEPGVPYLFEATGYDPIKFYKTTAAAAAEAGTSNGMVGTFVDKTLTPAEGENLYYFQGTHFYSVAARTKNLSVPANRCYVDLNEPHPAAAPAPGRRRITFGVNGTNTATGVENIQTTEISIQKVLIDGKMYILRGEKMYDATGRLVK